MNIERHRFFMRRMKIKFGGLVVEGISLKYSLRVDMLFSAHFLTTWL
jgi:hypothetical protein